MKAVIILLALLIGYAQLFGGWQKDSLAKNSIYIDRSRSKGEKQIREKFNLNEKDYFSYPLEIYSQLVNGFNYKVIFAFFNQNSKEVGIYTSTVYSGPFSNKKPVFEVLNTNKIEKLNTNQVSNEEKNKIDRSLDTYFKEKRTFSKYNIISSFKEVIFTGDGSQVYVLEPEDKKISKLIVFKEGENYSVDAVIYNSN